MSQQEFEILQWIKFAWPGPLVRESKWLFVFGETAHFMGICLLFGALIFIDMRIMGFFKRLPVKAVLSFVPYAILGFVICAASGWVFFTSNPVVYYTNGAFIAKMSFVLLAGLNAVAFTIWEHPKVALLGPGEDAPAMARTLAATSLILWVGVLLLGRWLPLFTVGTN